MANKNFSGVLRDPTGELAYKDKFRFTHVSTTGEVIRGSISYVDIPESGAYDFDLEYGNILIQSRDKLSSQWIRHGVVTINQDTSVTTLPALLLASVPDTPELVLQLEQILNDAETAATNSQASADAARQSALDAAASVDEAQDLISYLDLKIFQSPTDGGLTEIQTRTLLGGEVYEVRKVSDDSLATIYSDAAGTTEIVQNGTSNVSGSDGVVEFYIADGDYYIKVGSVRGNFKSFRKQEITLYEFGGSPSKTNSENKEVLQLAISSLDGNAGLIVIGSEFDYGYTRAQPNTWPDFTGLSSSTETRIIIEDYSQGSTGGSGRSGAQFRRWYHTGNQEDGQHNGNFEYIKAGWHPGHFITNDGDRTEMAAGAGINRRASTFYGTLGEANWRVGQGRLTGDFTEDELAQFLIAVNGLPDLGVTGLTTAYVINKTDGKHGWNIGTPRFPFDFVSRVGQGQTFNFETLEGEPTLRINGDVSEVRLISKDGGFDLQSKAGTVYSSKLDGRTQEFTGKGGNLNVFFSTDNKSRRFSVRDDIGSLTLVTTGGASAVVFGDDSTTAFAGTIFPSITGATDIGKATAKFKTVYTNEIDASTLSFSNVPTSDPAITGRVWSDGGTLKISAG